MLRIVFLLALTAQCVSSDGECPLGWKEFQDHCYAFFEEKVNWLVAGPACDVYNSYLVKIDSAAENEWLVSQLKSLNFKDTFTGGSQRLHTFSWEWVPSLEKFGSYSNWLAGEPNFGSGVETVLQFWSANNYKWNDVRPSRELTFVCERAIKSCDDD
uniref:Incilarin C n=1 Tax=Meghimatium fruhstorferi TaxID=414506 RepID=O02583_MEGFU|nr:Incilarin C [Meghimatium fruhstorferi]